MAITQAVLYFTLLNVPMNVWISLWGFSAKTEAFIWNKSVSKVNFWVSVMARRSFQSVSPSNWSVRMKQDPDFSVVLIKTISAGTRSSIETQSCVLSQCHSCRLLRTNYIIHAYFTNTFINKNEISNFYLRAWNEFETRWHKFLIQTTIYFFVTLSSSEVIDCFSNCCHKEHKTLKQKNHSTRYVQQFRIFSKR